MPNTLSLTYSLACQFRDAAHAPPSSALARRLRDEVMEAFARIPVPVTFTPGPEPFETAHEMAAAVKAEGRLRMRDYRFQSCVWLDAYNQARAVHDWYGHLAGNAEFGVACEIKAYCHSAPLFSAEQNVHLWNETVLANAFKDTFGPAGFDKVVRASPDEVDAALRRILDVPAWAA